MKYPIPNDWDGLSWRCLQLQIPDSQQWTIILNGLLTILTRGRYWDESTGDIRGIQALAWEIFSRSYPYVSCEQNDNGNGGEVPPIIVQGGSVYALIGDETMGIFLTDIYFDENGKLIKVYGPCCEKPVLQNDQPASDTEGPGVGDFPITWDDPLDAIPDLTPPTGEPPTSGLNWACRKAWTLGKAFEDLCIAAQGARNMTPWAGVAYLKDQLTYLQLGNEDAYRVYLAIQIWERTIPLVTIAWTTEQTESLICHLAPHLNDQTAAMTHDEFLQFQFAVGDAAGGGGTVERDMYTGIMSSVGLSNWRLAISSGVFFESADCTCPEQPVDYFIPVAGYEWIVDLDWTADDLGFAAIAEGAAHTSWELGVGWKYTVGEVVHAGINIANGNAGPGTITYMRHEYSQMFTEGRAYGPTGLKLGGTTKWYDATLSLCPPPRLYHTREFSPAEAFVADTSWEWTIGQIQKVNNVWSGEIHFTHTIIAGTGVCPWPNNQVYP